MKISFDVSEMEGHIKSVANGLTSLVGDASFKIANEIMIDSLQEVPVDTGTLFRSHYIEETIDGVVFGYGPPNDKFNIKSQAMTSEYMIYQHEGLHLNHPNGGKAKFLEDPINRHKTSVDIMAESAEEHVFGKNIKWRGKGKPPAGRTRK